MFWHNNYIPSVHIDSLLCDEDITLNQLMDAEDILQQCKSQNKKLIEYLTRDNILEELVNLIIEEPAPDSDERWRYKYSNVACELLTCNVPILIKKLANNEMLLSKLYSFIDKDQPLNPLLASFFTKTLHTLLSRASDQNWFSYQFVCVQVLESLKNHKNCVDLLLQHLQTSAIMDLILILITKIDGDELRQYTRKWLDDQQLVQRLVKLLAPSSDPEKHSYASQILCGIVKSSRMDREIKPDPILDTLQSEETIKTILDTILTEEKLESSINSGIRVLLILLGKKENKSVENSESYAMHGYKFMDDEQHNLIRVNFALIITPYLDKFNQLLLDPPEKPPVKTTVGLLEKPFGQVRLNILELYVCLISTENPTILKKFVDLNTFNILLDLFFNYSWNNFLHSKVQQCLLLAINCDCPETKEMIYSHIFGECKLIDRILQAWENNDNNTLNTKKGVRQGYMGHLINIANDIVIQCKISNITNILPNYLNTNMPEETMQKWDNFVTTKLDEINKKQTFAPYCSNIEQSAFVDADYNFRMQIFNDTDGTIQNLVDQFDQQPFNVTDNDFDKKQELFNKLCDEKKFEDVSTDDQWIQLPDFSNDKSDWLNKMKRNNSSSSDEEGDEDPRDLCVEVDPNDPWNSMKPLASSGSTSINLWDAQMPQPVEQSGWANFDNFNSAFSTDISFQNEPCNETGELPEAPIVNENISLPQTETGSESNNSQIKENVSQTNDVELKTEDINVSSKSNSDCIETPVNIPDSNANLTVVENRTPESKDSSKNSEESCLNIAEACSDNLSSVQIVTSATDNVSSITATVPEPSK